MFHYSSSYGKDRQLKLEMQARRVPKLIQANNTADKATNYSFKRKNIFSCHVYTKFFLSYNARLSDIFS